LLDDTSRSWWYEQDGQQAGPVTAAAIARLVAEGRLGPTQRVWRDGMAGWEPLGTVPELADALLPPQPAPPPLAAQPPAFGHPHPPRGAQAGPTAGAWDQAGAGWGPAGAPAPRPIEEISPAVVIILSIVTFGIYGLVKFHQTGKGYERLAGRPSTFGRDFWIFVGLGLAGPFLFHTPILGGPLCIASLVFGVLALSEALALRDEVIRRESLRADVTGAGTHKVLYVIGAVLSPILLGLVVLLVQAAKWFGDWNAVGAALAARGPIPTASAPAPGR
jgi:hypothetical protein